MDANLINLIIVAIVVIAIFLAGREWVCWYFKIHQQIDLLEEISAKLTVLINKDGPELADPVAPKDVES